MKVELEPDTHIEFIDGVGSPEDIHEAAKALFSSAEYLQELGAEIEVDEGDKHAARAVVMGKAPLNEISTSGSAIHLKSVLDEYDHQVVKSYSQLRQFIVNRLVEEAQPGQRQAIRALELLGKVAGVDLFMERSEVTVKTQTTSELQTTIRQKLARLGANVEVIDIPMEPVEKLPVELDEDPLDSAKEMLDALTG